MRRKLTFKPSGRRSFFYAFKRSVTEGYRFYIHDDWRARPWLTLNLGLRYELQLPMKESRNLLANFIPEQGQVVTAGTPAFPEALLDTDRNNIGPRIGFAVRPFKNDRTVIRGGGGIYQIRQRILHP